MPRELGTVDPEHEIAALQDLLRAAWGLMTEAQQTALLESDEAQAVLRATRTRSTRPTTSNTT